MDRTLLKGLALIFFCGLSQLTWGQDLIFTAVSGNTSCDNTNHCVDIEVTGFNQLSAFQFAIDYDTTFLTHVTTTSNLVDGTSQIGVVPGGFVRFSWFTFPFSNVADNTVIITSCFQPTGLAGNTSVDLGPGPGGFPVQAADNNFNLFVLGTDLFLNSANFDITDTVDPSITCQGDTTIMATGAMVINDIAPTDSMDNCLIDNITYTLSGATVGTGMNDASGNLFNPGTTLVTYEITDGGGNTSNCSFNVILDVPVPSDTTFTFVPEINLDCINGTVEMCMTVRNADAIEAIQVPFIWEPTQLDYQSQNVLLPPNGIIADGNAATGVAAFIWNTTGPALTLADGDSLFCVQYNILAAVDTALFSLEDLPLINIEVVSSESGTPIPVPFLIEDEIIFAQDNTPPTLSNCPTDTTIMATAGNCDMVYTWTSPTGMDDCIANLQLDSTHASGDLFPIGTTTVTYTITDLGGNAVSCSFDVTVIENEMPTVTCPNDTTLMVAGPVVVNNIDVIASDLCGAVSTSYELTGATTGTGTGNASGNSFNSGMTTVTYTVTDVSGNVNTCSFVVTVQLGPLPEISCPNDTVVVNDMGNCSAVVNDLAAVLISNPINLDSIHYLLSGATTGAGSPDVSGTAFNVGVTTVTYIATDLMGQTDSCMFTVTVNDTEDPMATCPPLDDFDNTPGQCGRIVNNNLFPATSDNCGVTSITYVFTGATSGSGSNDPTGSFFNVGVTNIDYTISDAAGNTTTCSVEVEVNDTDIPTIACPADTTAMVPFGASSGIVTNIDPLSIGDNCPDPAVTYAVTGATTITGMTTASGVDFNMGTNTVTYYVSDTTGNIDSCSFNVIVENSPLGDLIDCPNDTVVVNDPGLCGATVNGIGPNILVDLSVIAEVTFVIDGATMINDTSDASGTFFNTNISTVKYLIEDINGNMDSCFFTVTVNDTELPVWTGCPDTIPVYVDNMSCRQIASWNAPIPMDNCGIQTLGSSHMQGDSFDLGFTTVTYTADDFSMNTGTCDFVIWVRDTFPPVFTCPADTIINTTTDCSLAVSWPFDTPTDNCTITNFSSTQNPGDMFPVGVTTVGYQVEDQSGNLTQCAFTITIIDGAAPVFDDCPVEVVIAADGTIVSDPTGIITLATTTAVCDEIQIDFTNPTATDACDGTINAVQYDGINSGQIFTTGTTTTQSFMAEDASGNADTCMFNIEVLPLEAVQAEIMGGAIPCAGDDVTFNITNPASNATYNWVGPNNYMATGTSPVLTNVSSASIGTYAVICVLPGGCTSQATLFLTVSDVPDITATSNAPLCSDGSGDLLLMAEFNMGSPAVESWSWIGPNSFTSTDQNPTIPNAGSSESGTYTVVATGSNGCTASSSVEITVGNLVTPNINSDCGGVICIGESCLLLGTEFPNVSDNYFWTVDPAATAGLPSATNQSSIEVSPTAPGIYIFSYSVVLNGCTSDTATFVLTVEDAPVAVDDEFSTLQNVGLSGSSIIENDEFNSDLGISVDLISGATNGIATVISDGTFSYIPNEGFIGEDSFTYELCNNCSTPVCSEATVIINVDYDGEECDIPTVITPNGDLKNEFLVIDCLTTGDFPNNAIIIYNQWGDEVFQAAPYNNDWGGTFENKPLPDGVYYFLFDDGQGNEIIRSSLTIFR